MIIFKVYYTQSLNKINKKIKIKYTIINKKMLNISEILKIILILNVFKYTQ